MATPGMQPLEEAGSTSSRFSAWMGNAKRFTDLGIALPVMLYASGFVVLGCYSETHDLGLQEFPTIQFFSAGAGFLLIFSVIFSLALVIRQLLNKWFRWFKSGTRASQFAGKAMQTAMLASIPVYLISARLHWDKLNIAAMVVLGGAFFFSAELWARYYLYFISLVVCLTSLALYAFTVYPQIPASFGGGKPRHAHIQIDMKAISPDLEQQLVKAGGGSPGIGALEADVYLVTADSILIRAARAGGADKSMSAAPASSTPPAMVLELRRSDVSAIFWESSR